MAGNNSTEGQAQFENTAEAGSDTEGAKHETETPGTGQEQAEQEFASASNEIAQLDSQLSEAKSQVDQSAELPVDINEGLNKELTTLQAEATTLKEQLVSLDERKQQLDAEKGGEPKMEETTQERTDYLPEINLDSLLDNLPVQASGKEDRIKGLVNSDLYKFSPIREIAGAQNYADSDPVVTDIARKIQDQLWDKRVDKLKPEFQLVMKSDVPTGRDAARHLFTLGEEQLHTEIADIKQEMRVLEQRLEKLNTISEKERGPAHKGHMEFAQTGINEEKNMLKALESIGRTPEYFQLTDEWQKGDAKIRIETEHKIEKLLSK